MLANLRVTKLATCNPDRYWLISLGVTLSDGSSATVEHNSYKVNSEYVLPETPIKQIEAIYKPTDDTVVWQIVIRHVDGSEKRLGKNVVNGRVQKYDFAEGERLIGAKMEHGGGGYLMAVTFLTAKRA